MRKKASSAAVGKKKKNRTGFRLEIFNLLIVIVTVVITIALSLVIVQTRFTYDAYHEATEQYITCKDYADQVSEAMDYLTSCVRSFANTGDLTYLNNYFTEVNVTKRREHALDAIRKLGGEEGKTAYLESAVQHSQELMRTEYHSMRLVIDTYEIPQGEYPAELDEVKLTVVEEEMSWDDRLYVAGDLVQNTRYNGHKTQIQHDIDYYTQSILEELHQRQQDNSTLFSRYQQLEMVLVVVMIGILTLMVAVTSFFLIRPLRKNAFLIAQQDSLPVKGSKEMRNFAELYNEALKKVKEHQAELSYEASHDSLTGVHNRAEFDELYHTLNFTENMALVMIDVDCFKEVNDTYGHAVGDAVLKALATTLNDSFRSGDIICRIGGDEFAVLLYDASELKWERLGEKMRGIMEQFAVSKDSLPVFTLSAGVAFGSGATTFKALYKNADKALYSMKESTKNGIACYGEKEAIRLPKPGAATA